MRGHSTIRGALLAVSAASMVASSALALEVGKASAVNPAATANLRTITIGSSIAHKERIKTAAQGSVQILFVDKTSMTIGPNSDLTIDEYVYDPNAGTGKLAATLGKGALRFVGGQISHSGEAEIKTATAVVGIRGGVTIMTPQTVFAGYGNLTVTSPNGVVTLQSGEFTNTSGGTPTPPGPPPPGLVAGLIQNFQSAPGQSGGVPRGTASTSNVARAEVQATGGAGLVAGQLTPGSNQPPGQRPMTPVSTLTPTIQTSTASAAALATIDDNSNELKGHVGGILTSSRESGAYSRIDGSAHVILDPQRGRVQANFTDHQVSPIALDYQFGSQRADLLPRSNYTDARNFDAQPAIDQAGQPISTVDGRALSSQSGAMYTVTAEQAKQYAWARGYDLTVCACDYTRWGIWSSSSQQDVHNTLVTDNVNGFWVAGRTISSSDVPNVGRASYTGHVVAQVVNGSSSYVSAGSLTTTVDFASQSGRAYVSNFDGLNYSGELSVGGGGLTASLGASEGNRAMSLQGNFFRGSSGPVGEMGGLVVLSGSHYLGSGIFAARMR